MRDAVDEILTQWQHERPDVDTSAMGVIGRIGRLRALMSKQLDLVFAAHGLEAWEFDVLATLRRSGRPYELTVTALWESMMIASGTMTNRIDQLEARGLVERRRDANDRRVVVVGLTKQGLALVDRVLVDHARNLERLVGVFTKAERRQLEDLLRRFHLHLTALESST